ncbi:MAG: cryptochrome/photolyase family protein [Acidobacteriota bacterium]
MQLVVVLGDQLNHNSLAFDGLDPSHDLVFMAEVAAEASYVWSHKARITLFLSAMRHFRDELRARGFRVEYRTLDHPANLGSLEAEVRAAIERHQPTRTVCVEPGEYRLREQFLALGLELLEDRHFLASAADFARHAEGRKQLRMEYFYREMRKRHGYLMDGGKPAGGDWNYDEENRGSFPKSGPGPLPSPLRFTPDAITREVIALVSQRFASHPGRLDHFDWPVTAAEARAALDDFLTHRLERFGLYQDAMWTAEPWLYHSFISSSLNLKLLDPREVCQAAEDSWRRCEAPLAAVEGFIRQILGWREYVRGIYWRYMPGYLDKNQLGHTAPLPDFFWTGETEMRCLSEAIGQTLNHGYAHHIQRLMVTGLFTLLLGVDPRRVHEWYLAVYVDAVEWVELPNTLGMSQFADGGIMASKPYAATGKYIQRMSNYCAHCPYDPAESAGPNACPFTTLYWDFLMRHEARLSRVGRMDMQLRNLVRIEPARKAAILTQAQALKDKYA